MCLAYCKLNNMSTIRDIKGAAFVSRPGVMKKSSIGMSLTLIKRPTCYYSRSGSLFPPKVVETMAPQRPRAQVIENANNPWDFLVRTPGVHRTDCTTCASPKCKQKTHS